SPQTRSCPIFATALAETLASLKEQVKRLSLVRNPQQWAQWKKTILGRDLPDGKLTDCRSCRKPTC
ncbi:MAG: hypothetical protein ACJ8CB_29535, partial [Ktedonobacteraceae bacterium]